MFTLVDSCSSISRNASKSEYRRRTSEWRSLNAGILVYEEEHPNKVLEKGREGGGW